MRIFTFMRPLYIIYGDVLEHLYDPWTVIYEHRIFLKDDGYVIGSIPNIGSLAIVDSLAKGKWTYKESGILDATHLRFFTLHEVKKMFSDCGYQIEEILCNTLPFIDLNNFQNKASIDSPKVTIKNVTKEEAVQLCTQQFVVKAYKPNEHKPACNPKGAKGEMTLVCEGDGIFKFVPRYIVSTKPITSIIIVTFNSTRDIKECLSSIFENTSLPYEVIVVDNFSSDATREYLKSRSDVTSILNCKNKGFSIGCNQGIKTAGGEYIVLLNPDTLVTKGWDEKLHAHFKEGVGAVGPVSNYVAGLQKFELYKQEAINGKIDINHLAEKLYLWNRGNGVKTKLLIGFCMMIKKDIVDRIGMLDENLFLGSDDLEYSWRLQNNGYSLVVATDTFIYHKGQTSFKNEPETKMKQFTQESQNALYAKLETHYGKGNVPSSYELWGMDWFKPNSRVDATSKLASIVILTHNQIEYTKKCLESIYSHTIEPFELVIVDNGSSDGTPDYLETEVAGRKSGVEVKIIRNRDNLGFAAGNNQGIAAAIGEYIILLNNDVVVTRGWLRRLIGCADQNPGNGVVGPRTNFITGPQRMDQVSYDQNTLDGLDEYANQLATEFRGKSHYCWRLVGFCMLIKREVINKIGGLDPCYGLGNFEDDDFCIRLQLAGYKGRIAEDCFVHHFGGKTFEGAGIDYQDSLNRNWAIFKQKWAIPQNTPLNPAYTVIPPKDGFDPVKHFCPLPDSSPTLQANRIAPGSGNLDAGMKATDFSNRDANLKEDKQQENINITRPLDPAMKSCEKIYQNIQPLMHGSHPENAIAALSNLVVSFPDFAQAHNDLGVMYYQSGEKDKALKHYEMAAQLEPGNAIFKKNLADYYYVEQGRVEDALQIYVNLLEFNPRDVEILLITGHICASLQRNDDAIVFYNHVLEIEPGNPDARDCLANFQLNEKDVRSAI
ncbi:hypothetical protein D1AOALGA4SA_1975 [Olavius algarvensis Delta 1 endosymbiont]|nr:hypothetical protein D1AOALGA4SA_1975 [Olavius algarvensis Delta 1 endosymbiont]